MNLDKIGLIMLGSSDLERSVAFYRDRLGLALQQQIPGFAFFNGGGVTLALSEPLLRALPQRNGAVEVVFSVEHVGDAHRELAARGVEFTVAPRAVAGPMFAANFCDPDGHGLSIFGPE